MAEEMARCCRFGLGWPARERAAGNDNNWAETEGAGDAAIQTVPASATGPGMARRAQSCQLVTEHTEWLCEKSHHDYQCSQLLNLEKKISRHSPAGSSRNWAAFSFRGAFHASRFWLFEMYDIPMPYRRRPACPQPARDKERRTGRAGHALGRLRLA